MDPLELVTHCYNSLPPTMRQRPWEATDHGRKILETEDELNAYVAAYGEMHIIKCRAALQNFPFDKLTIPYEIFDWGCGQGLATLTLLQMLNERRNERRNPNLLNYLRKIYLIEPSEDALNRAQQWVSESAPSVEVVRVNKYIPQDINVLMPEVSCASRISINLFSNILDIQTLNLQWLAQKTASLTYENYMICVGPKFGERLNTRLVDFCAYFEPAEYFSNIDIFPYSYTSTTRHAYGCQARCFIHENKAPLNNNYQECADKDIILDPYEYATECLAGIMNEETIKFYLKLRDNQNSSYDIFLKPAIGSDIVDIALISKSKGVVLINTCDDLNKLKEEYIRLEAIKDNIFSNYLKSLRIDSIINTSVYSYVKTALFFPNATNEAIDARINQLSDNNNRNTIDRGLAWLYKFTPDTNILQTLDKINVREIRDEYYDEMINLIYSNWHSYREGDSSIRLRERQVEIIRNEQKKIRVKGVAGSGKTQVVANRAVEQHLRTGTKVLILTFNITLIQYIKMRIMQVPADFSMNMYEITNYHQFFRSKANRYTNERITIDSYDNVTFFDPYRDKIDKYDTIIIDEVQDFKEVWLRSIFNNFLANNGSISVFGDGGQNIYGRVMEQETKMPVIPTFTGRWNEMNEQISERILNPEIANLANRFANQFTPQSATQISIEQQLPQGIVKYWQRSMETNALVRNICRIIQHYRLNTRDVVVLGQSINLLRDLEANYVNVTRQKTMITFETASEYSSVIQRGYSNYVIDRNLNAIRRVAKTHFNTACEELKFATIHSFKGWEANTIILILQPLKTREEESGGYRIYERENNAALIYTALTRARNNLFIINLGNDKYHSFFKNNVR